MLHVKTIVPGVRRVPALIAGVYLADTPEGPALIDTSYPLDRPRLVCELRRAGLWPKGLRAVFITHAHPDHMGNAAFLKRRTGAEIVCSRREGPLLAGREPSRVFNLDLMTNWWKPFVVAGLRWLKDEPVEPDRLLDEGETHLGLSAFLLPGHTPGHCGFRHEASQTMFVGDAVLTGLPLTVTLNGLLPPERAFSVDYAQAMDSVRRLGELSYEHLASGHGQPIVGNAPARVRAFLRRMGWERPCPAPNPGARA